MAGFGLIIHAVRMLFDSSGKSFRVWGDVEEVAP